MCAKYLQQSLCFLLTLVAVWGCGDDSADSNPQEQEVSAGLEVLIDRNDVIWGFDFLPGNRIIFTEREGRTSLIDLSSRQVTKLDGGPTVLAQGEGGLMDVRAHPDFSNNRFIYFCYAEPLGGGRSNIALGRARLENNQLVNFQRLFADNTPSNGLIHFGCRIEFDGEGHLFLSLGERGLRSPAQNLSSHLGKVLRFNLDGSVPQDNPFFNQSGAQREIFSLGHRNVQGLTINPETGDLWASELGPVGGDEINIIQRGQNYGWPLLSHGRDPGGQIEGSTRPGFIDPLTFYAPSISPSALTFYTGNQVPQWNGDLFVANLSGEHLRRLEVVGDAILQEEELFENLGWRFRNVRSGPDGYLYFSTDEGRLVRVIQE